MNNKLKSIYSAAAFRKDGHILVDQIADYLEKMGQHPEMPVLPWTDPEEGRKFWEDELKDKKSGSPNELWAKVIERSMHIHHPNYMGHQVCAPAPHASLTALVTDWLNNGAGVYEMGHVSTMMEFAVLKKLAKALGFKGKTGGFFTSGGTLANLTALLSARSRATDVWQDGNVSDYALMVSGQAHYSVDRAVRIMGWGEDGIIRVPTDENYRIRVDQLEEYYDKALAAGKKVLLVVASACTTATGTFDNINGIADFCDKHKLWLHVDAAHGGGLAFSSKYRHLLNGIHRADSVTVDFHKMLMTPMLSTAVLFKDEQDSYHTFSQKASYLFRKTAEEGWYNLAHRAFECTKTSMVMKVYTLLHTYGEEAFDAITTQLCDRGAQLATIIRDTPNLELAVVPECNIVCFRLKAVHLNEEETNDLNARVRKNIIESGRYYIVQTTLNDRIYLRTTLISPFTEEAHLKGLIAEVLSYC